MGSRCRCWPLSVTHQRTLSWVFVAYILHLRLRGHRDQITGIRFLPPSDLPSTSTGSSNGFLISTSKDTLLKLWDLSTQHCVQTVVAHRSEVWSMDLSPQQNLIFTGSGEGDLKAWKIDYDAVAAGLKTTESGEVCITQEVYGGAGLLRLYRSAR